MSNETIRLQGTMDNLNKGCIGVFKMMNAFNELKAYNEKNKLETNPPKVKESVKVESKKEEKQLESTKPVNEQKSSEKKEVKIEVKPSEKVEDKITMQSRATCPVKVLTKEQKREMKKSAKDEQAKKEEEHHLHHLVEHLKANNVNFTEPLAMHTGLYELQIFQKSGQPVLISVDINGLLYCDELKFFIGRVNTGDEYKEDRPVFMMTDKSIEALVNNQQIPDKYVINKSLFILNKALDLQTLKEKDPKKRAQVFETCAKIISDEDLYNGIVKAANNEAWRFAFSRYNSVNDFAIVSSRKNLASNLSNDKLLVTKEIWINFKDGQVNLTTKSYS